MQRCSSKSTSINTINRVYTNYIFRPDTVVLDYGGGKYNTNKDYMSKQGVSVLVYDKYNRTHAENFSVLENIKTNKPDYIVCSNVLNVIDNDDDIEVILSNIYSLATPNTEILFTVYEGDGSGIGKETKTDCWQRNQKTMFYIRFLSKYFKNIKIKNKIIHCTK